ncbi:MULTISPECIES: recombinase family protein [Caproicibacterium]|jgi:transcriptional regulator NrdR family protein|uniref:Recombinase family protein n=1 Tax=Caproicibacterium argilliputei TaxID=3030016 RepID=A0AA97DB54_9FIRM|nr:recombinase family protein [Caproicibacterium argilliputei]WOC33686.1 recombinase family protein [Caproicibacterium argilliputei]
MKQNRYLPFGYRIVDGTLTTEKNEAEAVRRIYADYLSGMSYQSIAVKMSAGAVPYKADSTAWNKHMVKRILENPRYTGEKGFPPLINPNTYRAISELIRKKNIRQPLSEELSLIRKKLYCYNCGSRYERDGRNPQYESWCCKAEGHTGRRVSDEILLKGIVAALNAIIAQPEQLKLRERRPYEPSLDVTKLNNQINRELEKAEVNSDYVKLLIFNCAAEKYASCADCGNEYLTERLRKRFQNYLPLTAFDPVLFEKTVKWVLMEPDGTVHLKLMNDQIIDPDTTERSTPIC